MILHNAHKILALLVSRLREFRASRSGHAAIVFAVTLTPIFGSIGTAVDLTRIDQVRAAMQVALDATAKDLAGQAGAFSEAELARRADELFRTHFQSVDAYAVTITPRYSAFANGFALTMSGSAVVQSRFVRLLGVPDFSVTSATELIGGIKVIEVASAD